VLFAEGRQGDTVSLSNCLSGKVSLRTCQFSQRDFAEKRAATVKDKYDEI